MCVVHIEGGHDYLRTPLSSLWPHLQSQRTPSRMPGPNADSVEILTVPHYSQIIWHISQCSVQQTSSWPTRQSAEELVWRSLSSSVLNFILLLLEECRWSFSFRCGTVAVTLSEMWIYIWHKCVRSALQYSSNGVYNKRQTSIFLHRFSFSHSFVYSPPPPLISLSPTSVSPCPIPHFWNEFLSFKSGLFWN